MREILITSTVLILCILLIRRLFRGKISSRLQYALWLLAVLRLVIPVSAEFDLGKFSDFRLMDLVEKDESGIGERLEETIRLEEPVQMSVNADSILFRLLTTDEIRESLEGMPDDGPTSVFLAGTLGFSRLDVLWFLWRLGALAVGGWFLATNIIFARRLRKSRKPFTLPENIGVSVKNRLPAFYLAEGISSPCLYGLPGREAVYLTADVIDDEVRLRHVVVHELAHKKHGDSFWALLRGVLVTVYWFHPLVWAAAVCSKRDCELACDESALAWLGEGERVSYGETLLSIITKKGHVSDLVCTATTMTGSGKSVKERISFIAKEPKVLYAAVAGVIFLTAVLCLFVFTKDARFQGIMVDEQEGLTVTGADMQITLPASIGGISGCVVEKKSDNIVIYHIASQEEVGRFARMPLKDALELVDEGREVVPVGDYGYNYLLKAYLGEPVSRTEHIYIPAGKESGILKHEDIYLPDEGILDHEDMTEAVPGNDENPLLSKDWEVIPLEEGQAGDLPKESIAASEPIDKSLRSAEEHVYTPAEGESAQPDTAAEHDGAGETETANGTAGVPGTDSNSDDTTYIIDDDTAGIMDDDAYLTEEKQEVSVDYLPDEQITTTVYQPQEVNVDEIASGCYVYVKADFYGKVKESDQEEMAFIDGELKAAADQVIILSLNRERREALFDALAANRTPYLGDNAKVGALIDALPLPPALNRSGGFSMQTLEEPYSLRLDYEMSTNYLTKEDQDMLYFNAAMLFYSIGNVNEIAFEIKDAGMYIYYREKLEREFPLLRDVNYEDDQIFRDGLTDLHIAVETYLTAASVE